MRFVKYALLAIVLTGTTSCGGARPTKYYVLDVPAPPAPVAPPKVPVSLLVVRPVTSHLYRDDRIVYGSDGVERGIYEFHRWAQTPADMVQDLLISYLRASRDYRSVLRPGTNAKGDYIVRSYLRSLYEVDSPDFVARFSIHVDLYDPKQGIIVWSGGYSHDEPVKDKSVAAVVEALDKTVSTGMQQLTSEINQYFANNPPKTEGAH